MKLRFIAAFMAIMESFSNAFRVSMASGNCFCLRNITALFISKSDASLAYSELFIAATHQSYPLNE